MTSPALIVAAARPSTSAVTFPSQAHRQSPSPRLLRKRTRSQGPLLRRYYSASTLLRPCPTPAVAAACRDVEAATLTVTGLPRLPEPPFRRAAPTTPADRAGARVDCFPARAAFPKWQEGRHPHCHFRGLLRLHSRYGPPHCSAAQRRPLSRGSNPCGYPHEPLVSYRTNRQLSGWNPPPLVIRAFGAHCQEATYALQQHYLYSIASSASASSFAGISSPNVLAVLRLIVRMNFVGC